MVPVPAAIERTLQVAGAKRRTVCRPSQAELIQRLRAAALEGEGLVALFDARAIAGERHLLSAWAHLGRSRSRGEQRLRDRGAEFALWVAGDDQLPRALAKVGLADDTEAFVVLAERPRVLAEVLDVFELVEDPTAYPRIPEAETLERLGIPETERTAVPSSSWEGLVLERVALLELSAARSAPPPEPGRRATQKS
jgi:tRNA threonylcarbamoyladenosine modification (KEOPS) complex Cgi121 subunit